MKEPKLKLFASCLLTRGISRSSITDCSSGRVHLIPNSLYDLLHEYDGKEVTELYSLCSENEKSILEEYLRFLEGNNLIFYTDSPESFPSINKEILFSSPIENMIIEVDQRPLFGSDLTNELEYLRVKHVEIRYRDCDNLFDLEKLLDSLSKGYLRSIDLYITFIDTPHTHDLLAILDKYKQLLSVVVYKQDEDLEIDTGNHLKRLIFSNRSVLDNKSCGIVNKDIFNPNLNHFLESLAHNTCLNRKVTIDGTGNIKNCPSMEQSFGNINSVSLREIVNSESFKVLWGITKECIEKCQDCEFRNICTDCRAYTDMPGNMYAAPLKCGYDPKSCTWEEWSESPLKSGAISHYGLDFSRVIV